MKPIIFHTNLKINFNNCAQTDSNSKKVREKNQLKQRQLFFIIFILKVLLEYRMPYDHMYPSLFSVIPLLLLITSFFFLTSSPPIPMPFFIFAAVIEVWCRYPKLLYVYSWSSNVLSGTQAFIELLSNLQLLPFFHCVHSLWMILCYISKFSFKYIEHIYWA